MKRRAFLKAALAMPACLGAAPPGAFALRPGTVERRAAPKRALIVGACLTQREEKARASRDETATHLVHVARAGAVTDPTWPPDALKKYDRGSRGAARSASRRCE